MLDAKSEDDWNHTSSILCLIFNVNSKRKKKPKDFNPLTKSGRSGGSGLQKASLSDFKERLLKRN